MYVIQGDHQIQPFEEDDDDMVMDLDNEPEGMTPAEQCGFTKTPIGTWASCLQVIDPKTPSVLKTLPLERDECAVSLCFAYFSQAKEGTTFLAIGSARNIRFYPLQTESKLVSFLVGIGGIIFPRWVYLGLQTNRRWNRIQNDSQDPN